MVTMMRNSSVLAAVVVGSALLAFSSYCSVDAAGSVRQRNRDMFPLGHNNIKDNDNLSRFLPEEGTEEPTSYYYYAKKSKKESKKKSKGYYSDGVSTAEPTPGCKASKKSNKDDGCTEEPTSPATVATGDDEVVEISVDIVEEDEDEEEPATETPTEENNKSYKSEKNEKSYKSYKSEKKIKAEKSIKIAPPIFKSSKKSATISPTTTISPTITPPIKTPSPIGTIPDDNSFVPQESWKRTFNDAVDTGFLFYDPITKYAWYAYNADVSSSSIVSISSASSVDNDNIFVTKSATVEENVATMGRICPMDTADEGKVIEKLCIEITPPKQWSTATSTEIQSVEACYGGVTGAMFKLAVVVRDNSKFMQFYDDLVGSRLIVYDIVIAGKNAAATQERIIVEVAYEGWASLYGESTINGRPAFSPDCKTVYATWVTTGTVKTETDGSALINDSEPTSTTTIATNIEFPAKDGESYTTLEQWRLGTNSRLVGLTSSKDGKTLFSATNVPEDDLLRTGGMVQLDATSGKILQEYPFANEGGLSHNAYTNVVLDDDDNTYHIDSLLGLVKFDGGDLQKGPIWKAVDSDSKNDAISRNLEPQIRPRDNDSKNIFFDEEGEKKNVQPTSVIVDERFTAYKPALDASDYATVYGCGGGGVGNKVDGAIALGTEKGESVWFTSLNEHSKMDSKIVQFFSERSDVVVDIGSCSGITDDIRWAPSAAAGSGNGKDDEHDGIYIARGNEVQCLDSKNGTLLWSYAAMDDDDASKFVVVSDKAILVANAGSVVSLQTTKDPMSNPPSPVITKQPTPSPTLKPVSPTPSPVNINMPTLPSPTPPLPSAPPSSANTRSCYMGFLSGLPLVLFLLR